MARLLAPASLCGLALLLLLASATAGAADASSCSKGDAECFCKAAPLKGTWKPANRANAPLLATCKITYDTPDGERYAHVYLPPAYDGVTPLPVWVHLHGVFWATMGDIGKRAGVPINGTDIIPAFDHSVELLGDKAVIVYPQSGGDPGRGDLDSEGQGKKFRQFWRIPFWSCSVGICAPKLDDVAFLETLIADLPRRLPLKQGHYLLSGESAGGMMVHALLCQSKVVPATVDAAVDILGGVGADFAAGPECAASPAVPFLKLHGETDPFITYKTQILVDGVNFASAIDATQLRARANGCAVPRDAGPRDVPGAGGKMECTDWCGAAPAGTPPAKLCGMPGVGHDTDFPHPGFVYEQTWAWFDALPKKAKSSRAAAATTAAPAPARDIAGPLQMNVSYPSAALSDMTAPGSPKAAAALAAVSAATGLPERNITARYAAAGSRRLAMRRSLLAADAVVGTYTLETATPRRVARAVAASVRDGSLLRNLKAAGVAPASLSLAAAGGADQPLIKPTELAGAVSSRSSASKGTGSSAAAPAAEDELLTFHDEPAAAAAPRDGAGSSGSGSSPNVGAIVGGVVGGVVGAALLVGAGVWAARAACARNQQLQQQQQQQECEWAAQAAAKEAAAAERPRSRPGAISLTADASMVVSDAPPARA